MLWAETRCAPRLEGLDVFEGGDGGGERWRSRGFFFAAPEAGHDEDGQLGSGLADGNSFFGGGDAEKNGSGFFKGASGSMTPCP